MINSSLFQEALSEYKELFSRLFNGDLSGEKFKWEAVQCFQKNWNLNASDFADMLKRALHDTGGLLANRNNYPGQMIQIFAEKSPEEVRTMFRSLYDEDRDIYDRISEFKRNSADMLERFGDGAANHYQTENAITTYLWLRYPDKYYIFKYGEVKSVAEKLETNYLFKQGDYQRNIKNFYALYDELCDELKKDSDLRAILDSLLDAKCYPDPEAKTLTVDFGFYVSRYFDRQSVPESDDWWPSLEEYSPGFNKEDWLELLNNPEVIGPIWGGVLAGFYGLGGSATCSQVAQKYGLTPSAISGRCTNLAKRIQKVSGCPILEIDERTRYWPILFQGKNADSRTPGVFTWRLRPELISALQEFDIMSYEYEIPEGVSPAGQDKCVWLFAPGDGAEIWDTCKQSGIMAIGWGWVGPVDGFHSVEEIKKHMNENGEPEAPYKWPGLALWQIAHEMKPGDIVFAKTGRSQLLGRGEVEGDYYYDESLGEEYRHCRKVKWTETGSWTYSGNFITKTLTDITPYPNMVKELNDLIDGVELPHGEDKNYWILKANLNVWGFSGAPIGERRRIYQNARDVTPGDIVFGYDSSPVNQIVALAKITEQDGDRLYFEKTEDLTAPIDFHTLKNDPELAQMRFFTNPEWSLFKLTKSEAERLIKLVCEKRSEQEMRQVPEREPIPPYTPDDFLSNVYMSRESYNTLRGVLKRKKNVLLEGAPGVGKTYAAQRFAWSLMGEKDNERIAMVQFHQSYTYEDFIMGFRPTETGFELSTGVFYEFCKKASADPSRPYFFIIDEINRGNLSKIFGELFMLIENENRGKELRLLYKDEMFAVPGNLYIIGMMNTADRSLAMIDYALRRRFSFFPMKPAFDSDGFKTYQAELENEKFDKLIDCIVALNKKIADDEALGEGFCIGHSYFCNLEEVDDAVLSEIVEYEIIPLIREYWFDEPTNVRDWSELLRRTIR